MQTPIMTRRFEAKDRDASSRELHQFHPSRSRLVNQRLGRMMALLEDKRMTISLMGRDRTGIVLYLSRLVAEHDLNIDEVYGTKLQREHGSFFLITGPDDKLQSLAHQLEEEKDNPIEGEAIIPHKVYDLTFIVPDCVGLIHRISSALEKRRINIRTLWSFVYPRLPEEDLDLSDPVQHSLGPLQAYIAFGIEVGEDTKDVMRRLEQDLRTELRELYSSKGTLCGDQGSWKISLKERRPDSPLPMPFPEFFSRQTSWN
jgi:predicted amino acid-binding ACT domain protein